MKENYQMNAFRYIVSMFDYVKDWCDIDNIISATEKVFWHTGRRANVEFGSVRVVVMGTDFVIKWDYDLSCANEIGGCEDEFIVYKKSLSSGYSHLLAPVYRVAYRERYFYIMPRVHNIGLSEHQNKGIESFTSYRELQWLEKNIGDLHSWNWGIENNKAVVIDYACRSGAGS